MPERQDSFEKEFVGRSEGEAPDLTDEEIESLHDAVQDLIKRRLDGADIHYALYLGLKGGTSGRVLGSQATAFEFACSGIDNSLRGSAGMSDGPTLDRIALKLAEFVASTLEDLKKGGHRG